MIQMRFLPFSPSLCRSFQDGSVRAFDYLTGAQLGSLTSFAIKREVNGRTYVVGLEFHVKLNVLLIAFHGYGIVSNL